jgi:tRNA modification GTPase
MAKELEQDIRDLLADSHRGERLREGLTVAVAGPVNVGKSSIVNRLAKRSAAIVSPHARTTRDIRVHLDLGGFPVTILDTAGMLKPATRWKEGAPCPCARANRILCSGPDTTLGDSPPGVPDKPGSPPVWVLSNKAI